MTAQQQSRTTLLCGLVGAWGVLNGFAVYILWTSHDKDETRTSFLLGLLAAATASWIIESLRERLRPAEALEEKPAPERTRIARLLLTLVSLATFELFIAAIDRSLVVFSDPDQRATLRNHLLGPALIGVGGVTRDLLALAGMWILAGAALSAALAHVVMLPRSKAHAVRSREGLLVGIRAGALAAPLLVLIYVLGIRIVLALRLALFDPRAWVQHVNTLAPPDLLSNVHDGVPWPIAIFYVSFRVIGPLFTFGWLGKLGAFAIAAVLFAIGAGFKKWLPFGLFCFALVLTVVAPLARDFGDLLQLPLLAAAVWVVPGAILGATAPLLENPAQRARLWASVSVVLGVIVMVVTFAANQDHSYLIAGLALIVAGAVLLRRDDLQIAWPFLAIAVSLATSSTTAIVLHVYPGLYSVLTNVAKINALPANIGEDPHHLVEQLRDYGFKSDSYALHGLRERDPYERMKLLAAARADVSAKRATFLGYGIQSERNAIGREDAQLDQCRGQNRIVLYEEPNVCIGAPVPTLLAMTVAGLPGAPASISDAALRDRLERDRRLIAKTRTGPDHLEIAFGHYSVWSELPYYESLVAKDVESFEAVDADIDAEDAVAAVDAKNADALQVKVTAYKKAGYPEQLELAMAGSVAFWMTVALLAAWQARRNAESAEEEAAVVAPAIDVPPAE